MENMDKYIDAALNYAIEYVPKIVLVALGLWVGLKVINWLVRMAKKAMLKSKIEDTLSVFISNLLGWALKVMLFISAASYVGIETTAFVAVLGAAGLAIGLSLQGALANLAGGVLLIIFKPYKVGDVIKAQGEVGEVKEVQVFSTILVNPDNETIIIPNGPVVGGNIKNFSKEGMVRLSIAAGISYDSDIKLARKVLIECMDKHDLVLKDPEPSVIVTELADSAVNLSLRPWCLPGDYWTVSADIIEAAKDALDAASISIPFPQMDVHLEKV